MIPECFQAVLWDIGIFDVNQKSIIHNDQKKIVHQRLLDDTTIRKTLIAYLYQVGHNDEIYKRFMNFLRVYKQPLNKTPHAQNVVKELIDALQNSIDYNVIFRCLHNVIYYALSIDSEIITLRRRSFSL